MSPQHVKRTIIVLVVLAIVAAAAPWAIGWRTEQLVRARVAQVDVDKAASIRLRIDSYQRGWRGSKAQISVIDRDEVVTTVRWREGQLIINGFNMNALSDMARALGRR